VSLRRHLASQDTDTVTLNIRSNCDATPAFVPYVDYVTLFRNIAGTPTPWFVGLVTAITAAGSAASERQSYTISGPWYHLQNRVYRQDWAKLTETGYDHARTSHLMLGQKVDWTDPDAPITVYDSVSGIIDDILTYIESLGAPIAHDVTNLPTVMVIPIIEERDITAAEAIRRVLRWLPDIITWWDYSTTPYPTLHFSRRANLTATTLAICERGAGTASPLSEVELTPRYDLQVPCVSITYEQIAVVNGVNYPSYTTDTYPVEATGDELGAYVATINLQGSTTNTVSAAVTATAMDISSGTWWGNHLPTHAGDKVSQIVIDQYVRLTNPSTYPREITAGAVYPWMPVLAAEDTVQARARITYQTKEGQIDVRNENLSAKIIVTNAPVGNHTYSTISESESGEEIPTGLSQSLYTTLSVLQYSGKLTLREQECGDAYPTIHNWLGHAVSISGSAQSTWASMAAAVQTVDQDIDTGTTTLIVGPAEHLSPQDLVQLLLMTRRRTKYVNPAVQAGGILQSTGTTDISPQSAGPGATATAPLNYERLTIATADGTLVANTTGTTNIQLAATHTASAKSWVANTSDLAANHQAKFRRYKYCMTAGPQAGNELDIELLGTNPRTDAGVEYDPITGAQIT
jgi:hypothetical protein